MAFLWAMARFSVGWDPLGYQQGRFLFSQIRMDSWRMRWTFCLLFRCDNHLVLFRPLVPPIRLQGFPPLQSLVSTKTSHQTFSLDLRPFSSRFPLRTEPYTTYLFSSRSLIWAPFLLPLETRLKNMSLMMMIPHSALLAYYLQSHLSPPGLILLNSFRPRPRSHHWVPSLLHISYSHSFRLIWSTPCLTVFLLFPPLLHSFREAVLLLFSQFAVFSRLTPDSLTQFSRKQKIRLHHCVQI